MKNSILLIGVGGAAVLAAIVAGGALFSSQDTCRDFSEGTIDIGETQLNVAVAQTPAERTVGLIGCDQLPKNAGMYFPYESTQIVNYWMKGMTISLDIVWIADGKVVGVAHSVPPVDKTTVDPPMYNPPVPVNAVLEVAAGQAREYGLVPGATVNFVPK